MKENISCSIGNLISTSHFHLCENDSFTQMGEIEKSSQILESVFQSHDRLIARGYTLVAVTVTLKSNGNNSLFWRFVKMCYFKSSFLQLHSISLFTWRKLHILYNLNLNGHILFTLYSKFFPCGKCKGLKIRFFGERGSEATLREGLLCFI